MILPGNYIKILEGLYEGEIGIVKSFDGLSFVIKLKNKSLEIKLNLDDFKLLQDDELIEKPIIIRFTDRPEERLKEKDLRYSSDSLRNNSHFKGLFSLGKYYSKEQYPDDYEKDYFTNQALALKYSNQSVAQDIAKIYEYFIKNSEILKEIVNKINFICYIPSFKRINHIEQWGSILCKHFNKQDISKIFHIPKYKEEGLKYYKRKIASDRFKAINGAFKITKHNLNLKGKTCLILDDICTTGLQINELTNILVAEGVKEIYAFVIARAKY